MIPSEIRDYLHFDPFSGVFFWIKKSSAATKTGTPVGRKLNDRYARIMFRGKNYLAHRLAWWFVHGDVPEMLDHINGDTGDNRISNLRPSNAVSNGLNRKEHRRGLLPYTTRKNNGWQARYKINKKDVYVGVYKTAEEAHEAALKHLERKAG